MRQKIIDLLQDIIKSWGEEKEGEFREISERLKTIDLSEDEREYLDLALHGILSLIRRR